MGVAEGGRKEEGHEKDLGRMKNKLSNLPNKSIG